MVAEYDGQHAFGSAGRYCGPYLLTLHIVRERSENRVPVLVQRTWVLMGKVFHESLVFPGFFLCVARRIEPFFLGFFTSAGDRVRLLEHRSEMSSDGPDLSEFELSFLSGQNGLKPLTLT